MKIEKNIPLKKKGGWGIKTNLINSMDIDDSYGHVTNAEMYEYIREHLDFDQMIWEFGNSDNPDWIHVSYVSAEENRGRCLRASRKNGKTTYSVI